MYVYIPNVHKQGEVDLSYEEDLSRNPYSLKLWWRYIQSKREAPAKVRYTLYERALKHLPGSYKLWFAYLQDRRLRVRGKAVNSKSRDHVNNAFERALVTMNKMPVIWIEYCKFLIEQRLITRTRRAFDRALAALPITQHHRLWDLYIDFIKTVGVKETAVKVYRRYIQLEPRGREDYVDYLISIKHFDEAAAQLAIIVDDDAFISGKKQSKHALWMKLCDLCSKNPLSIKSVNPEKIIRSGVRKYPDETGHLWCKLADYFIRKGSFEKVGGFIS
jgi:pre-mRNA-splicing factor SYF1